MTRSPRLDLTPTQVLASALAAVTATVAASYFGVSGTVVGAALASVLTVTGNAVYGHSLRRTGDRVRDVVPARARRAQPAPEDRDPSGPDRSVAVPRPQRPAATWRRIGVATTGVFVAVLAVVTSVELVTGRPVSTLVRGDAGSGTTVFGTSQGGSAGGSTTPAPAPALTVTRTVTPSVVVVTPTVTRTAAPTSRTATPTPKAPTPKAPTPKATGTAAAPTPTPTPASSSATP